MTNQIMPVVWKVVISYDNGEEIIDIPFLAKTETTFDIGEAMLKVSEMYDKEVDGNEIMVEYWFSEIQCLGALVE
jgi:hypothetical protein